MKSSSRDDSGSASQGRFPGVMIALFFFLIASSETDDEIFGRAGGGYRGTAWQKTAVQETAVRETTAVRGEPLAGSMGSRNSTAEFPADHTRFAFSAWDQVFGLVECRRWVSLLGGKTVEACKPRKGSWFRRRGKD